MNYYLILTNNKYVIREFIQLYVCTRNISVVIQSPNNKI